MKQSHFLFIVCLLFVCIFIPFFNAFGVVRELGMGEIGTAYPQTAMAARYNPAGIIDMGNRTDFALGCSLLNADASISGSKIPILNQKTTTTQGKYTPLTVFGITKILSPNLSVALNGDIGIVSSFGSTNKSIRAFGRGPGSLDILLPSIALTVAKKINEKHCLGVSIPFYLGRFKFAGGQNLAANSLYPNNVSNRGFDWAYGWGLKFGWLYHITDCLNFGISYTTGLLSSSKFHKYKGLTPSKGKFESPADLLCGIAYRYGRGVVGLQARYFFFTPFSTLHNSVNAPGKRGAKNGPGSGINDVVQYSFGIDYDVSNCLVVRAGYYHFGPTFVRRSNVASLFIRPRLGFQRNNLSCGATYNFKDFDVSSVLICAVFKRTVKSPPIAAIGNGVIKANFNRSFTFGINVGKFF